MQPSPSLIVETKAVKPGWQTTEFWITAVCVLLNAAGAVGGLLPAEHAAWIAAGQVAFYKVLRLLLKFDAGRLNLEAELAALEPTFYGPDANRQARGLSGEIANWEVKSEKCEMPPDVVRPVPPLAGSGAVLILGFLALTLGGCAGSPLEQDFRRKVQAVEVTTSGGYDAQTHSGTGQISTRFELRNPDAKTVRPPRTAARPQFRLTPPQFRRPEDVPESWQRTLYHGPRVIVPITFAAR